MYRELPDTKVLLEHPLLKHTFTLHEKSMITDPHITPSDQAENFIMALERKGVQQYLKFLKVLSECRLSLSEKLIDCDDKCKDKLHYYF